MIHFYTQREIIPTIFLELDLKSLRIVSQTCKLWNEIFHSPSIQRYIYSQLRLQPHISAEHLLSDRFANAHPEYEGKGLDLNSNILADSPNPVENSLAVVTRFPEIEKFNVSYIGDNNLDFSSVINATRALRILNVSRVSLNTLQGTNLTALRELRLYPLYDLPPALPLLLPKLSELSFDIKPASNLEFIAGLYHLTGLSSLTIKFSYVLLPALKYPLPSLRKLSFVLIQNQHLPFAKSLLDSSTLTSLQILGDIPFNDLKVLPSVTQLSVSERDQNNTTAPPLIRVMPSLEFLECEALSLTPHLDEVGFLGNLTHLRGLSTQNFESAVTLISKWVQHEPFLRELSLKNYQDTNLDKAVWDLTTLTRLNNLHLRCSSLPHGLLRQAVANDQTHLVADLFQCHNDINPHNFQLIEIFQEALSGGHTAVVREMLKPNLISLETPFEKTAFKLNSLLYVLVCWQNTKEQSLMIKYAQIVDLLIEAGARVSCMDLKGRGPFHFAKAIGDLALATKLKVALDKQVQQLTAPLFSEGFGNA